MDAAAPHKCDDPTIPLHSNPSQVSKDGDSSLFHFMIVLPVIKIQCNVKRRLTTLPQITAFPKYIHCQNTSKGLIDLAVSPSPKLGVSSTQTSAPSSLSLHSQMSISPRHICSFPSLSTNNAQLGARAYKRGRVKGRISGRSFERASVEQCNSLTGRELLSGCMWNNRLLWRQQAI